MLTSKTLRLAACSLALLGSSAMARTSAADPTTCFSKAIDPTTVGLAYNDAIRLCHGATDAAVTCLQTAMDPTTLSLSYNDALRLCSGADGTYDPTVCFSNAAANSTRSGNLQLPFSDALALCAVR